LDYIYTLPPVSQSVPRCTACPSQLLWNRDVVLSIISISLYAPILGEIYYIDNSECLFSMETPTFFHLHMMQKNYIHTNYINKSATSRQVALTNNYQCVFMGAITIT